MIRIRRGDFNFSDDEIEAMIEDVEYFKRNGADGIVIGCLHENEIHVGNNRKLICAWGAEKPVTFHRAFDETDKKQFKRNIDVLEELGIRRLLTSGFESTAEKGIDSLKELVAYARERKISVMPGAGINKDNVAKIVSETSCTEIHASARSEKENSVASRLSMGGGSGDLMPLMICDVEKARELINLASNKEALFIRK